MLFCLAEDVLSRAITNLVETGVLSTISGPRNLSAPSHVLYADDVLVFCKSHKRGLDALMKLFHDYGEASGQFLSLNKCKFYSGKISLAKSTRIVNSLGFSAGSFPFNYLGVPLFMGKPKRVHLQPIADRIMLKFASWKGNLLSIMGRVELVKTVIQSMLLYSFHVYVWPSSLLKHLDNSMRNFIWSGDPTVKKICTVAWHKMCLSFDEGGIGLKSLKALNEAFF